ncbi:hypothetical protein WP12_04250 [Sphingomonas sp. SRS2]|nr:hypothetical protein WP12_04250 [Sphingomonas sp. SRS2]
MPASRLILAVIVGGISWGSARAQSYREELIEVVRDLNSDFICPRFLSSDKDRELEIGQFSKALADIGVSYDDAVEIRRAILQRHHCIPRNGFPPEQISNPERAGRWRA